MRNSSKWGKGTSVSSNPITALIAATLVRCSWWVRSAVVALTRQFLAWHMMEANAASMTAATRQNGVAVGVPVLCQGCGGREGRR